MTTHTQPVPNIKHIPLPLVIIGAGPVGLAAAAHAHEEGLDFLVLEAGPRVGDSMMDWGHVQLFSPWRYNINRAAERQLTQAGWSAPDLDGLPTGHELVQRYLDPLADLPQIRERLRLSTRVLSITRDGRDKVVTKGRAERAFMVRVQDGSGNERDIEAAAVIDASGTWKQPNPIGSGGVPAIGETVNAERIHYGIPDLHGHARKAHAGLTTMVIGAGHSAANALLSLAELAQADPATRIIWAVRGSNLARVFGGGADDQLPARGELGERLRALTDTQGFELITNFAVTRINDTGAQMTVSGQTPTGLKSLEGIDRIIATTGQRPDISMLREVRTDLDNALESVGGIAELIDPNVHSCGTIRPHGVIELAHPEPGFFIAGMKSYGRAPTFLMTTGYEQVRSIIAALAGDMERARDVQLELPETGVCSSSIPGVVCCAGGKDTPVNEFADTPQPEQEPKAEPETEKKADQKSGCGCGCAA